MLPLAGVRAEMPFPNYASPVVRDIGSVCQTTWSTPPAAPVVVMLISPRMVYSMLEWPRMRSAALAAGFEVVTWKAPGVSGQEWASAIQAARWTPSQSALVRDVPAACAAWMQRPNHFPFSEVALDGLVHAWPIWGVLSDEAWTTSLALRLKALKDANSLSKVKSP
jgi:hypothetical protein